MTITGRIHSIESFGTVDGPGTRMVVFMQGCPMRCLYCHNPDTWEINSGKEITTEEILRKFESMKEFYKNGGITVSGGEPLMQTEFVTELFEKFQKNGIHCTLDTSGIMFTPNNTEKYDKLIKNTNLVLLDIKHINDEEHKKLTGHSNKNIIAFAEYLSESNIPVWIRHVCVPGITYNEEYLRKTGKFISMLKNVKKLEVLPYHNMAIKKYESMDVEYKLKDTKPLTNKEAEIAKNIILSEIKGKSKD